MSLPEPSTREVKLPKDSYAAPEGANNPDAPAPMTKGQKVYKWVTYLGVDWLWNAISGVAFTYWGKHTESGQKYWSQPITGFFKKTLGTVIKDEDKLNYSAGLGTTFMSIIAGGMATIPPLMVLESKKIKTSLVRKLDNLFYGKEAVENNPHFEQAYKDNIENAPEKEFGAGMKARFAALAPLLALVLIPQTAKPLNNHLFQHIGGAGKWVLDKTGISNKMFKNASETEKAARWDTIKESFGMDFSLGIPYATLHAFFYDKFAKGDADKKTGLVAGSTQKVENPKGAIAPVDAPAPVAAPAAREAEPEVSKNAAPKERPQAQDASYTRREDNRSADELLATSAAIGASL